jgi:hypothetical protein
LRRLSSTSGTTAALSAVIDDRITVLELVGPAGADVGVRVGQSYPFAPPVGLMFVLWDDAALRDWLAREPTIPLRTDGERLDRVIAECRRTGYLVERLTPGGRRLYALMAGMSSTLPDELRALLGELIADIGERVHLRSGSGSDRQRRPARFDVSVISAPVFDHHQRQAMVVSLQIGRALTEAEIAKRARALTAAADALTGRLGGTKPAVLECGQGCLDCPQRIGLIGVGRDVVVELPDRDERRLPCGIDQRLVGVRMSREVCRQFLRHRTDGGGQGRGVAVIGRCGRRWSGVVRLGAGRGNGERGAGRTGRQHSEYGPPHARHGWGHEIAPLLRPLRSH